MKNIIKINSLAYLLALGVMGTQVGCSSDKKTETTASTQDGDSETAYTEFKDYVASVESSTNDRSDSAKWAEASAASRAEYDTKVARIDQYSDQYDESRRQEIDRLKSRYSTYWGYDATSDNGGLASETNISSRAAIDFNTSEIGTTSARNIRMAYENFVTLVASNKDKYTKADWQAAENYFKSLDDRKNAVQSELTAKDKYEIAKAKSKYTAIKAGRLGIDASEAANTVSDDADNVGADVKDATKSGASKVGNAAEKAGSQVKSTIKSGAKKIDRKIDDNPNVD